MSKEVLLLLERVRREFPQLRHANDRELLEFLRTLSKVKFREKR